MKKNKRKIAKNGSDLKYPDAHGNMVYEYRTADKSTWGDGPWQKEPDKKQWTDPETGYACLIVRNTFCTGALCGYVGVPKTHPAFGLAYDGNTQEAMDKRMKNFHKAAKLHAGGMEIMESMREANKDETENNPIPGIGEAIYDIRVHGGLTFSGERHESKEPSIGICHIGEEVWWFGFDCSHSGDWSPKMDKDMLEMFPDHIHRLENVYRDIAYVTKEVTDLASQLKRATQD